MTADTSYAAPLLNLETLIVRPAIEIDGTRFEILSPDELSVIDTRRFGRWSRELEELQQGDQDGPELEELVTTIARKVLVSVPDQLFAKLTGTQKIAVVEVFTGLLLRSRMRVAGATGTAMGMEAEMNRWTGGPSSLGSNDSTGAPRGLGWRTRLWRWFSPTRG